MNYTQSVFTQPVQTQTNPFTFNFTQQTQTNPFANLGTNFQSADNLPLIDKIRNLKMPNVEILSEADVANAFGADVIGIDVCCVNRLNNKIIVIKQDKMTLTSLKDVVHFTYSSNIIEKKYGTILKIYISNLPCNDVATNTALNRNGIICHVNGNTSTLTTETANYVRAQIQ